MTTAKPKLRALEDQLRFLLSWASNPKKMGAVAPSGKVLAATMAAGVDLTSQGPVIELGPGTGPVTKALLMRGIEPSRIVALEYDGELADRLRKRYPGITVIHGDAYDLSAQLAKVTSEKASAIISSLPLFNEPSAKRVELLRAAFDLLAPDAPFVQFTYSFVSPIPLDDMPMRADKSEWILKNVPPARVWTYRQHPSDNESAAQ